MRVVSSRATGGATSLKIRSIDGFKGDMPINGRVWRLWDRTSLEQRCKLSNKMQQFPFIDLFIDLVESALHVSGDKLERLQEHFFDCMYSFGTVRRAALSVQCDTVVSTFKKCPWRWASMSPETCRADSTRSIKISINENCCILLVAYINVRIEFREQLSHCHLLIRTESSVVMGFPWRKP